VLKLVYGLNRPYPKGLYRYGPVYGFNDDNNKIPREALGPLTNVGRIGVLPVGNLSSCWESPFLDNQGKVISSGSQCHRKSPFDFGALVFNSSLLGTTILGPSFWKHNGFGREEEYTRS
jgi:hypothetical protein